MANAPSESIAARAADVFAAYRDGDRQRMGELVDLLTPVLWHTARSAGLDVHAAEDTVQVAWLRLVEKAETIDSAQAVLGWLITTVRRESWARSRTQRRAVVTDDLPDDEADYPGLPLVTDPAQLAVLHDGQRRLWRHVDQLPRRCRDLLRVVAFVDRPDYTVVSEALGMPVGSIGPTRGRCLAKLRAALAADPEWEQP